MKIVNFPNTLDKKNNNSVVAVLGKFNSIHLGHRELLKKGRELANESNSKLMIMLFSEREESNFYSFAERVMFVNEYTPDYILEFAPTKENFSMRHEDFEAYLKDNNITNVVCGHDFNYGSNREGSVDTLKEKFNTHALEEFKIDGKPVRTRYIFDAITNGDISSFKEMMGYYFFYNGIVVRGKGNGKKFGMPTANVAYPKGKVNISEGIYYSYVIYDGKRMPSLTSISKNPTLDAEEITYETYIYNFDKDIYGEEIFVELIEKYRDSIKFNSIEELVEALSNDKKLGIKYFNLG